MLSLKAGGTGLNLTAASHVVLYDRWWNPAVEDQARDRAWRIGQTRTVICHRLICPGTVDERVEEVVAGKRRIADLVLPKSSSLADLDSDQLRVALGIRPDAVLTDDLLVRGRACRHEPAPPRARPPERPNARRRPRAAARLLGHRRPATTNVELIRPPTIPTVDDPVARPAAAARSRDDRGALLRRRRTRRPRRSPIALAAASELLDTDDYDDDDDEDDDEYEPA